MKVSQVYSVVNSLQSQLFGDSAVAVTDTRGLRSLGDQVIGSGGMDKFVNALVDRIGKTIIRTLDTKVEFPDLLRNEFEFGAVLQKINFNIPAADENTAWNIADPSFTPDQFDVTIPDVKVVYFTGTATWRVRATIPDDPMLNSAFDSAQNMAAFISGITDAMEKSMILKINAVSRATIASLIAEKADLGSSALINVLTVYNTSHTPTLTADQAVESPDFLRWLAYFTYMTIGYMDTESTLYNEQFPDGAKVPRRTSRDNMHVWLHSIVAAANSVFLQSDTYHRDLVEMPMYKEIKMWQGSGTNVIPDPADTMTIHVTAESGDDVECTYVIGCLADRESVGVGKYQVKVATDRNNINGYTNFATLANIGHYVDLTENAVIFTLADPTITQPTS